MAPQQNSTLIDDNLAGSLSLLNMPEELTRYSPILPPKSHHRPRCNITNNNNNNTDGHNKPNHINHDINHNINNSNSNNSRNNKDKNDNDKKITYNYGDGNKWQRNYKSNRTGSSRSGGRSHRSRSISLYGVNSTVEQGSKEIPIWIDDEPRYVSGVTNKTTCNDIIKALIDDEIQNGNLAYCRRNQDGAASRDYSDYVLTESWRGIERSYNGNMAILPVWKAWSRVHNELRLALKHRQDIQDPMPCSKSHGGGLSALRRYLGRLLLRLTPGTRKSSARSEKNKKQQQVAKEAEKCLLTSKDQIPDEFLFVILPDKLYTESNHMVQNRGPQPATEADKVPHLNKNLKPSTEESEKQAEAKLLKDRLYRLSETRTTSTAKKRRPSSSSQRRRAAKDRHRHSASIDPTACIRRRKDTPIRHSIRNQLALKTHEVDRLYDREYALTKELTNKCKLFKLQNALYTNPEKQLELSVGQIQRNIENYAEEIVRTEHELLELKNEIKQDISIINNLKRMTLEPVLGRVSEAPSQPQVDGDPEPTLSQRPGAPEVAGQPGPTVAPTGGTAAGVDERMQFVDNIYEFCDNNASMLV